MTPMYMPIHVSTHTSTHLHTCLYRSLQCATCVSTHMPAYMSQTILTTCLTHMSRIILTCLAHMSQTILTTCRRHTCRCSSFQLMGRTVGQPHRPTMPAITSQLLPANQSLERPSTSARPVPFFGSGWVREDVHVEQWPASNGQAQRQSHQPVPSDSAPFFRAL